jgi:hypothetical protein
VLGDPRGVHLPAARCVPTPRRHRLIVAAQTDRFAVPLRRALERSPLLTPRPLRATPSAWRSKALSA